MPPPITTVFAALPDSRVETASKRHALTDILTLAVCAILGGAARWEQFAEYCRRQEAFFRRFLPLANGIPSHDTFYRVLAPSTRGTSPTGSGCSWRARARRPS